MTMCRRVPLDVAIRGKKWLSGERCGYQEKSGYQGGDVAIRRKVAIMG